MAEIVVSAAITVLCERLISTDLLKLARSEGIDSQLNKWKKTLPLIQAVLDDASQKQIADRAVQLWVNDLHNLAYDIDDVLDDLATEAGQRKLNHESHASTSSNKVLKIIPTCCTNFTPRNIMYGRLMSSKLDEISNKLRDLVDQKINLGLNVNVNAERPNRLERRLGQTSLVDESKIMGRKGDKEALLKKLLRNERFDQNVGIVSIVGLGGIGKTTLAKVVYNHEKVKDEFEFRIWVCVSGEFDVLDISKAILEAVSGEEKRSSNLDLIHVVLKEKLLKKKFLLVLDDVWNEDESKWELLQSPLVVGAPGSKIMVTTRNTRVVTMMDSDEVYHLDVLSNEDALSLFAQNALGEKNFDKHPTLKLHGEGIMKKCGRLPLALKTLGRVLKTTRNVDEWEKLLNSEIWDIEDGSEILPALKLSYYHLPPHLKQLFAYCSLFPKDYVFDKNELVLLWMAEGFLSQSKGNNSMENLGHHYFEKLKSRSFFQNSTNDELRYTMHGLINDLATSVAGEFFFRFDELRYANETFKNFRLHHFSFINLQSYAQLKKLKSASCLRTFLPMSGGFLHDVLDELLPKLQYLRVLSLANQITKGVPNSVGSLKHLRYLNFSYCGISDLPEQITDLYNLQSLLLRGCFRLSCLPKGFIKLINLRHLDMSDTPMLTKMPLGIGGLISLQTLTKVIIEETNTFKISELKRLLDLQGRLSIMGLDKVIHPIQAKDASLHQKKGLDVLELVYSDVFDESRNEMIEYEVLKELTPHHNLKNLKILFFMGMRFPSWVGDPVFDQLTEVTLRGCTCSHLPTLGHLNSLKKLIVQKMNELKTIGLELLTPTNSNSFIHIAFPSLEVLKFLDMQNWEKWSTFGDEDNNDEISRSLFPRLHKIFIKHCPKLTQVSIGLIPSLRVLHIKECSEMVLRSMVGVSTSLVALKMWKVKGLTQLHEVDLMHLGALENLYIDGCDELMYLWEQKTEACKSFVSLKKLEIRNCKKLVSLSLSLSLVEKEREVNLGNTITNSMESLKEVIFRNCDTLESYNCLNSVERLVISCCHSLTSLTFSSSFTKTISSDCVFCLTSLDIRNCKNLKSFPYEHFQSLTSLEQLSIYDCQSIDYTFPCGLWPPNLSSLVIGCLNKPMSEWSPQNFPTSLVELHLNGKNSGVVSFVVEKDVKNTTTTSSSSLSFLLPKSLASLTLDDFMNVESVSEVLQHLSCLKRLHIMSCPKLRDLPEISSTSDHPSSSLTIKPLG
ncbi:putative disease resistance protein At3g14460 [Lactuca sativa]|uniref:putative disease resistance protein At3g14460 n=1 Tax=Lactuca sativa TaxID=4236 RepID=UPI0022B04915|nr:putative disease resistance protein At3g14460 [Lactuca sativa]